MQELQLIGVHEDGEHLLFSGADGARFRTRVDDPLRAAIRRDRPRLGQLQIEIEGGLRPRDVQAMIRSGASAQEAADRAGWSIEKVHRYEGPILAEREHVAGLARAARLRARNGATNSSPTSAPTLSARVAERLKGRGVDVSGITWDSWRAQDGPWTVALTFAAGGRQRQAQWDFDLADKTATAIDDEARWLSDEVGPAEGPIPAPHLGPAARSGPTPRRATKVYDVEADGGLRPSALADRDDHHDEHPNPPLDLMTAMRERSTVRGRRAPGSRRGSPKAPTTLPGAGDHAPHQALPLEDLAYDPETMPPPPGAHVDPDQFGANGRPEPEAAAYLIDLDDEGIGFEVSSPPDTDQIAEKNRATEKNGAAKPGTHRAPRKEARKGGRLSVPAWDEIMFGSKRVVDQSLS